MQNKKRILEVITEKRQVTNMDLMVKPIRKRAASLTEMLKARVCNYVFRALKEKN